LLWLQIVDESVLGLVIAVAPVVLLTRGPNPKVTPVPALQVPTTFPETV
jgi:hypothetical protein